MKELDDTDPMPFGAAHKGVKMEAVHAKYLQWCWCGDNGPQMKNINPDGTPKGQVADYIRRNLSALAQEHKDGIW